MLANERQVGGTHYQSPIQHWDYVLANDIPYLEAQVIRYLTRWRNRVQGREDLQKAQHYLQKIFEVNGIPWEQKTEPVGGLTSDPLDTRLWPDAAIADCEPSSRYAGQDRREGGVARGPLPTLKADQQDSRIKR